SGDAFVAGLNASGSALVYSTYLGGGSDDTGIAIAVDFSGNAYVAGATHSEDFPTANPFQFSCDACSTGRDAFVAKISPLDAPGVSLSPLRLVFASQTVSKSSSLPIALKNVGTQPDRKSVV